MIGIENILYVLEIKTDFDKDGEVYRHGQPLDNNERFYR